MKFLSRISLIVFSLVFIANSAYSQAPLSEQKRSLISEIIVLTKMDTQMAELSDVILKYAESSYDIGFAEAIDVRTDLTSAEKEKLKATLTARYRSFSQKFRKRLPEAVDFHKYIEEAIYPLYDKFYTEKELKDIADFYRTETGQKVITTMPQLYAESLKVAQEKLIPQVLPLMRQLLDEDLKTVSGPPSDKTRQGPPPPAKRKSGN